MFEISQGFKYPLEIATRLALGEWMLNGVELVPCNDYLEKIYAIATVCIAIVGMIFSIPVWFVGEAIEIITEEGYQLFNDEVELPTTPIRQISLASGTKVGAATSSFQSTSDPNFCCGSAIHEALKHSKSELGKGVDILNDVGRQQTLQRLRLMNANLYRFSIEWPDVKKNGLDRYIESAKFFHENGIEVIITLDHWLGDGNVNFLEKQVDIQAFVDYAAQVYQKIRPFCTTFLTFNEPNVDALQRYVLGDLPPNLGGRFWTAQEYLTKKLTVHREVHKRLHELEASNSKKNMPGTLKVVLAHQAILMMANSRWNLIARVAAFVFTHAFHESFMRIAEQETMKKSLDALSIQYYARPLLGRKGWQIVDSISQPNSHNPDAWMVDGMQYRFDPQGVLPVIQTIYNRLQIPLMITEAGTAGEINPYVVCNESVPKCFDSEGNALEPSQLPIINIAPDEREYSLEMEKRKAKYYEIFLLAVSEAQKKGIPLDKITIWTMDDNLEWQHGRDPKCMFGITARDSTNGIVRLTQGFEIISQIYKNTNSEAV